MEFGFPFFLSSPRPLLFSFLVCVCFYLLLFKLIRFIGRKIKYSFDTQNQIDI